MLENSLLLKSKTKNLPNKVGVYLFLNKKAVLYVGKSNKIKARVLSYFKGVSKKHQLLISSSTSINYILVDSEEDALFLTMFLSR